MPRRGGWIGVDLDGTLAHYSGWAGERDIGEPIQVMLERVRRWVAEGIEVRIFTARVTMDPLGIQVEAIQEWLERHGLPRLAVTAVKDYMMIELWDDRAVAVRHNTGEVLSPSDYL